MATYSGASPTPGTAATVIEDPAGAEPDAEEPPNTEQPASSRAATAQPTAIRMRPPPTRWADRPIGLAFIELHVKRQIPALQDTMLAQSVPYRRYDGRNRRLNQIGSPAMQI